MQVKDIFQRAGNRRGPLVGCGMAIKRNNYGRNGRDRQWRSGQFWCFSPAGRR